MEMLVLIVLFIFWFWMFNSRFHVAFSLGLLVWPVQILAHIFPLSNPAIHIPA